MDLPASIRRAFQAHGREGGLARARSLTAEARGAIARTAASRRWITVRFGAASFERLGLPGATLIDQGLADLGAGRKTAESLLVALAAPRLRREGVPVPVGHVEDPDMRLYRLLEAVHGELAHARYLALLRQAASFADACAHLRRSRGQDAR